MKKAGFTLIEVLMAIILVGIAIAALVGANISFTKANSAGTNLSIAEFLTEQIRELTALLPVIDPNTGTSVFGSEEAALADYDDLDDFDDKTFSPPITASRETQSDFVAFSQQITVENVSESNFEQVVGDHSSFFVRITVNVLLNSQEINSASWIRAQH
jgi:prepilin-type N-terminal cleavage/methylation domain-containing protein